MIYSGLLIVCNLFASRYYPQIEDFLCGCNYCESLNIGRTFGYWLSYDAMSYLEKEYAENYEDNGGKQTRSVWHSSKRHYPIIRGKIFRKNQIMFIKWILLSKNLNLVL